MRSQLLRLVCAATLASTAGLACAADYDLSWYTFDGGGAMGTTGGNFELSGTVGQPDAGAVLTGGSFELAGGFWPVAYACPGDCNCDGRVDFGDINAFVAVLSGGLPCWFSNLDMNSDGRIDFADINPFVAILSEGGGNCP